LKKVSIYYLYDYEVIFTGVQGASRFITGMAYHQAGLILEWDSGAQRA
jgi:hypothetical protein